MAVQPSNEIKPMATRLAHFINHQEICSEYLRGLSASERDVQYQAALGEWNAHPLMLPLPGNKKSEGNFHSHCDEMIRSQPTSAQE